MSLEAQGILDTALAEDELFKSNPTRTQSVIYIKQLLKDELPVSDRSNLENDVSWTFVLDKQSDKKIKSTRSRKKKTFLTRKERKKLNILKLPKTNWNYSSLKVMREMWKQYMRENLDLIKAIPKSCDAEWINFNTILLKSEFVGAEVSVIRSTVPSLVDLSGTIVLETKMTFQIVTKQSKLKIVPKECCVFEIILDNIRFTIFGKHLITRPSERSVKKIKSQMTPDL